MKTKYTLQELKKKGIIIDCPSKEIANKVCNLLNIKPIVKWESDKTYLWVYWSDSFSPDFFNKKWVKSQEDKKVIPASEFFIETPEEKADEVIAKLDEKLDSLTPSVILEATAGFDLFLKEWNALHKKAIKIKSLKGLKTLTDKIKELL